MAGGMLLLAEAWIESYSAFEHGLTSKPCHPLGYIIKKGNQHASASRSMAPSYERPVKLEIQNHGHPLSGPDHATR